MHEQYANARVDGLVSNILDNRDCSYGVGSMTCSIYDTAWVACVSKTVNGVSQWLFPCSFRFVLDSQSPDGAWPAHPHQVDTDELDTILSTLAALFCLTQHARHPLQLRHLHDGSLSRRIESATVRLSSLLQNWRVGECKAVGFEVLVPSLLDLLEDEDLRFHFRDKNLLLATRDKKLMKLPPDILYRGTPFTLIHSLEAFHGRKDFDVDRVSHHKIGGSMMASPSATASYLIRSGKWDDEAEAYLRLVISNGEGNGSGGVPSAYPSTNFELTWVVSTLLEAGVMDVNTNETRNGNIVKALEESRSHANGLMGFAPQVEPDLDDSAKASVILSMLGRPGLTRHMVDYFDSAQCLKTYRAESNHSVSANCNALLSMVLDSEDYPLKITTMEKVTVFICESWWKASGSLGDKWNISPFYPMMLMARSLIQLLCAFDKGRYPDFSRTLLQEKIILTLFLCLIRTIKSQSIDGSWGLKGYREETAYAVITLVNLLVLPLTRFFRPQILSAVERGRAYLFDSTNPQPEYLWIEKVTYSSVNLAEAYNIAALLAPLDEVSLGRTAQDLCSMPTQTLEKFGRLIDGGHLPEESRWIVSASSVAGGLFISQLRIYLTNIRQPLELERSLNVTACRWIFADFLNAPDLSPQSLGQLMKLSFLSEQLSLFVNGAAVDQDDVCRTKIVEPVHKILMKHFPHEADSMKPEIDGDTAHGFLNGEHRKVGPFEALPDDQCPNSQSRSTQLNEGLFQINLQAFLSFFDKHDQFPRVSTMDMTELKLEAKRFLQAQLRRLQMGETPREHDAYWGNRFTESHFYDARSKPTSQALIAGYHLIFATAICLTAREGRNNIVTGAQMWVVNNLRDCVASIALIEHDLNELEYGCGCLVGSSKEGEAERLCELLKYEKRKLEKELERLGVYGAGDGVLRTIKTVVGFFGSVRKGSEGSREVV